MNEHLLTYYLRVSGNNYVQNWDALNYLTLKDQKRWCVQVLKRLDPLLSSSQERVQANLHMTISQLELFVEGSVGKESLRVWAEMLCTQDRMAERYDKDANLANLVSWCCEEALTPERTYPAWNMGALACAAHKWAGQHANMTAWGIGGLVQVCTEHMTQRDELQELVKEASDDDE